MIDHELLKLAAKAAGYYKYYARHLKRVNFVVIHEPFVDEYGVSRIRETTRSWDPINDDGDAFRLMVQLRLKVEWLDAKTVICGDARVVGGHPIDATRRVIVLAAARMVKEGRELNIGNWAQLG